MPICSTSRPKKIDGWGIVEDPTGGSKIEFKDDTLTITAPDTRLQGTVQWVSCGNAESVVLRLLLPARDARKQYIVLCEAFGMPQEHGFLEPVDSNDRLKLFLSLTHLRLQRQDVSQIRNPRDWLLRVGRNWLCDFARSRKSAAVSGGDLRETPDSTQSAWVSCARTSRSHPCEGT